MRTIVFPLLMTAAVTGIVLSSGRAADTSVSSIDASSARNTYVIVHGGWGAGYEWKEVGRRLQADSHSVYRVTLTGMGERSHLANPDIDLETHIMDVVNTILFEDLHDVILVGHSYGGMVITGVADRVPERLKQIMYVDAFLPENGESADSAIGNPKRDSPDGYVHPFWKVPPGPPPHAVPQPAKTFTQPIVLKNQGAVAKIPTTYLLTVDPGKTPEQDMFFRFYERARARGWNLLTMESDHTPQFSHVPEIVRLLEALQ